MSVPRRSSDFEPYTAYDADDFYESAFELSAGERIGGPASRTNDVLAWCTAIALVVGGGWIMVHDDGILLTRFPELTARVSDTVGKFVHAVSPPSAPVETAAASLPYAPSQQTQAAPPPLPAATQVSEPSAIKSESLESGATDAANESDASDAKHDNAQSRDSYQARAEAAGLNPDISRALLMRFSPDDFRNARVAIQTAIAKTPDDGVFTWPRQRKPGTALFKVHFVEGAGPDCRRYVVSVTMDNWTTTALPMEKCGVPRVASRTTAAVEGTRKHATP
jgi:hypothetical protein